jgi:hypothetical protein
MSISNNGFLEIIKEYAGVESGVLISIGAVKSSSIVVKFGHCPDADAVETDVWELGATQPLYIFPEITGETLTIESSDALDDQIITIQVLNETGVSATVMATLTGTTPVAVAGTITAVNRAYNSDSTPILGTVLVKGAVSGNTFAVIDPSEQQTTQCVYTVPSGEYAIVKNVSSSLNSGGNTDRAAVVKFSSKLIDGVFRTQVRYGLQQRGTSNISSDLTLPPIYPPLTQLKMTLTPDTTDTDISAEMSIQLIKAEDVVDNTPT